MKLIVLLLSIFMLSGCQNTKTDMKKIKEVENTDDVSLTMNNISVFSDVYLKDLFIFDSDIKIINENEQIDTESIGEKTYEIIYEKDNQQYAYKFNITIVDNEAPKVFSGTNRTITKGYDGDICNVITYGDNYDGNIKCLIEGEYNVNKVGTYKLKYILSDSSNNTKEVNVTLNVVEKNNSSSNTSTNQKRTSFTDVLAKYKNDNNEIGIDVSKWQGNIDFEKVKNAGATFVMMRIGVQKTQKGELEIDPYFEQNFKNAKAAGLKVGVYLYSIATSKEEAIEHANWVLKTLNKEPLDLPIVFDWENWSRWNSYKISFHEINAIKDNYIKTVKNSGYEGMLYSSKFYLETIWENKNDYPVWLAHYTSKTSYTGKYIMWQLCNDGKIDGINGAVDIDVLYN